MANKEDDFIWPYENSTDGDSSNQSDPTNQDSTMTDTPTNDNSGSDDSPAKSQSLNEADQNVEEPSSGQTEKQAEQGTSDSSADDVNELQEVVPELHPDVHRDPLGDVDVTDAEEIADALVDIDQEAALTIERIYRRKENLENQVEHYKEQVEKKKQEFQNFKQRKNDETEDLKDSAAKDFIKELLPIRDNLERALEQDSEDIRSGVEIIRQEFDETLEEEGVSIISPDAGEAVDPEVHEVMTRVASDVESGKIAECYRPGYKMDDLILRPARVTVSDGSSTD